METSSLDIDNNIYILLHMTSNHTIYNQINVCSGPGHVAVIAWCYEAFLKVDTHIPGNGRRVPTAVRTELDRH